MNAHPRTRHRLHILALVSGVVAVLAAASPARAGIDADGAWELAQKSGCTKCHTVDRKKDGPAYRDVAAVYKDKPVPEAESRLTTHITSGEKVKFDDGHEEAHKKVKTQDQAQIHNLVDWILSLEGGRKYTPNTTTH